MKTDYTDYTRPSPDPEAAMSSQPKLDLGIPAPKPTSRHTKNHPNGGELPAWIIEQLHTNKKRPATRHRTQHHHCRHCSEIVITGAMDLAAKPGRAFLTVTIDPTPLTPQLELACTLTGRATYRVQIHPPDIEIIGARRARWEYTWHDNELVLPAHQCGARFDGFHTPPATPIERTTSDDPDGIPF